MSQSSRSSLRRSWRSTLIHTALGAAVVFGGADLSAQASAATRPSVGKTVKAGTGIYELAVSPSTGTLYVASTGGRDGTPEIRVFDAQTLDPKATITVPVAAYGLVINDRTQTLYSSNTRAGSVTAIDLRANRVVREIKTPEDTVGHMRELVVDEEANRVYASSYGRSGAVWVIDGATNEVLTVIQDVGNGTAGLALDAAGKRLYASNIQGNDVSVIDLNTNRVVQRIPSGGEGSINIAIDPATSRLFVANQGTGDLTVLDGRSGELLKTVKTGEGALGVRFDPANGFVYVANRRAGTVSVVDGESYQVIANLETGSHPNTVVIDAETNLAYVTNKARSGGRGAPPVDDPNGDTVTIIRP